MAEPKAGQTTDGRAVLVIPRRQPQWVGELETERADSRLPLNTEGTPESQSEDPRRTCHTQDSQGQVVGSLGIEPKEGRPKPLVEVHPPVPAGRHPLMNLFTSFTCSRLSRPLSPQ